MVRVPTKLLNSTNTFHLSLRVVHVCLLLLQIVQRLALYSDDVNGDDAVTTDTMPSKY